MGYSLTSTDITTAEHAMFYFPSTDGEPPMGRLPLFHWIFGALVVVPAVSWLFVHLLALVGLFRDPRFFTNHVFDDTGTWIWLGIWQLGNVLWTISAYRLDAWEEKRCARRHSSAGRSPVVLRRRNRLLVSGRRSRLRSIVWLCAGPGNRVLLFPVLTCGSLIVAHGVASIEEQPNSVGPQPLIALFFVGVAVVCAAMTVYRFWAPAQLIRNGHLVPATVVAAGSDGSRWRIDYQFLTPAGEPRSGSEDLAYRPRRVPSPGDHVTVLYAEKVKQQRVM